MTAFSLDDRPKSLGIPEVQRTRRALLQQQHVLPLTRFVELIRAERGLEMEIPYFDPADGGVDARVLFVLQAPGRKAIASGFISRDNPDETAKNVLLALRCVGIPRHVTLLWNVVPWFIGSDQTIRSANGMDIDESIVYLNRLIDILPKLEAIALVGKTAQQAINRLTVKKAVHLFLSPHPSPQFVNRLPENRSILEAAFRDVARYLGY